MGYLNYEPVEFIAEDYIDTNEKVALAQGIIAVVPKNRNLDKSFLKNIVISERIQSDIQEHATDSTVYGIKAKTLKTIKIPLPPADMLTFPRDLEAYKFYRNF